LNINVLHINDNIENKGGVETNIKQLCDLAPSFNMKMYWTAIFKNDIGYSIEIARKNKPIIFFKNLNKCIEYFKNFCDDYSVNIIHLHSISNPSLIDALFDLRPVVRSMRDPRMFCPGHGKFFRKSERICDIPYGLHCFYHSYKESCCNRHPKRLIKSYINVVYETKIASKKYAAIIVMSDYMIDEALKVGYNKKNLIYNPHLTPTVSKQFLIDSTNDKVKSLVYVGRLSITKGVHYAIKCVTTLLDQGYKVQFDIVGSGEDESYFKSLIPEKYSHHFIFHGWQHRNAVDLILLKAYVLLFPSIYPEAFGISGIEAMMRAKPVVGFNVGGVSTWLKDQQTGFLVNQKNYKEMAERVATLIDNNKLYKFLSSNSRKLALDKFSEKNHMTKLYELYWKIHSRSI
jgi:glycosyltransferase involved in cell wall biosynthesis